jgi:broad specificity phosphatase PhoE
VDLAEEAADSSPVLRCDETCNPLVKPLSKPPETSMALPELESAKQKVVSHIDLDHWVAKFK